MDSLVKGDGLLGLVIELLCEIVSLLWPPARPGPRGKKDESQLEEAQRLLGCLLLVFLVGFIAIVALSAFFSAS